MIMCAEEDDAEIGHPLEAARRALSDFRKRNQRLEKERVQFIDHIADLRISVGGASPARCSVRFVHLPPTGTDPHRWINPEAVEWFAAHGTEAVLRLRTGDTIRTSLSVTVLGDRLAGHRFLSERSFEPHEEMIDSPPGDPL